ncbi:thaumatin family protein [Legionella dresdenensis]|uniref:Thaumatin family protein n=1 Tax=Legionella dresdenensis TaxID=450200 RepID=A0ABV8CGK3_9GAMM
MTLIKNTIQALSLFAVSTCSVAGIDPVKWVQQQSFPAEILVDGGTYVASYTFTNQIPATMVKPLIIEKTSNSGSEFSYEDLCTGKRLAYRETCNVTIYLNPTIEGSKTVQLIQAYGNDRVPLPQLYTIAVQQGGSHTVVGDIATALPSTLGINTSAPWRFIFTNNNTFPITGINISVSGSSYDTNCGLSLTNTAPGNSCYVEGTFTAMSAGPQTITATLSYSQGSPVTLSTSTVGDGQSSGLICQPANPLASEVLINTSAPATLLCTNKSGNDITIDNHVTSYPSGGADGNFVPTPAGGDNCTAQVLPNNASCQLSGTYTAPASAHNGVIISLLVNYHTASTPGLSSQTSTTTNVVTAINNIRTIHLINNCNFNVWWSMVGGAITNTPVCSSNSDCPSGSTCNTASKICYFNNYGPQTGSYELTSNGGTATTQIIQTAASTPGDQVLWKGLISASTQCNGSSCLNNDCQSNGGTTSCAAGVGFQQPATEAEFTLQLVGAGSVDTYDISNVNGFSMPISMATSQSASNYTCGTAGNNVAAGSLQACNYSNVTPPTNMYYWVSNTGVGCTSQNMCSDATKICGLAFNPNSNSFVKNCGSFLGYWAANQICQTSPSFSSPFGDNFSCNQMLSNPFPSNTYTLTQLLKCSPPSSSAPLFNSCYLNYSGYNAQQLSQCCGCTDWPGIANPSASCPVGQVDPQWTTYVQPLIQWMKQACPTSYSYPYDDKASTFQCAASASNEYTITFCPGNGTGLPAGKTDGR